MNSKVFLYGSGDAEVDLEELGIYLKRIFMVEPELRGDFFSYFDSDSERIAERIAELRVVDISKPFRKNEPFPLEVKLERKIIKGKKASGLLYDGFYFMEFMRDIIPKKERKNLHLYITDRLLGTFDDIDARYHARTIILGYPCIVSTSGIVEAPAKPKEYYIEKGLLKSVDELIRLKENYRSRFIDYDDRRMQKVVEGYSAMAVFYHYLGEVFCTSKKCRLYNAHWQEELIEAQLSEPDFCTEHEEMRELPLTEGDFLLES
ncbi:hypothetical protein IPdc08_01863 [archaeon]|nr:hypothetical protein IPdc08_01863 [archaeon]